MREFTFPSKGAGQIQGYCWQPEGQPRFVVQLVHGIAEHMRRYDAFARWLTAQGALVVAEDHMGHGKSTGSGAPFYFAGGWEAAVADTRTLLEETIRANSSVPYFLFGHSMGSFMVRDLLCRNPELPIAGAIVCGTGWQPGIVLAAGRALCAIEKKRLGPTRSSKLMIKLMFGAYNAKFKDAATPNDWICSDKEVVRRYTADPLCGGPVTTGLAGDLLYGLARIQKNSNLKAMRKDLPVLFVAGRSDPVGAMGKGVEKTVKRFEKAGMQRLSWKLFEGRHEILNEPNRQEVWDEVKKFVENLL